MKEFKWLWQYLHRYRWGMIGGFMFNLLVVSFVMVQPYMAGMIVDQVIRGGQRDKLGILLAILVASVFLKSSSRYCYQCIYENISQNIIFKIREDIYKKLMSLHFGFFDKTRVGDIMSRMTGDTDAVRHFVAWVIYQTLECSMYFIVGLSLLCSINYKLALILLMITPFVAFTAYKLANTVKPTFVAIRNQFSKLNSFVQENISGNRVVKAFAKENYEIEKFERENAAYMDKNIINANVWGKYIPILDNVGGLLTSVVLVAGGFMVIKGQMTYGQLVTFNSLLFTLNNPLRMTGWLINDAQRFSASADKIIAFMNNSPEIYTAEDAVEADKVKGKVEFKNVSFSYGDEKVLEDISFKAYPGQTIAIIGPTGAGKSTIINLLCRFYDVKDGEILVDNINVKNYDVIKLRDNIAMTMQDVFLYSDTIEGNIAYGVPDASLDEVKWAADIAGASEFIDSFADGYDTIIGERGVGLSGGQKQRIALARAILKRPSILILDDTTSSVDMETEHHIQSKLADICKERTTFIIAHRISSVKDADLIMVVDNGRIIERGQHDELIRKDGYYHSVFMNQFGDFDKIAAKEVV